MKKIGILGGMGPVSTVYFYDLIVKIFQDKYEAVYHSDYPYMVILNIPIPDNVEDIKQKNEMKKKLIESAKLLEKSGVDFISMPCNTEHIFYKEIIQNVSIPMLNIIEETIKEIKKRGCKDLLLLSTSSTIKYRLYEERGINIIKPSNSEQKK